jgi:PhnB protein
MARVSTYLNFMGNTEAAFTFYKGVFGTEFIGEIQRMGDVPSNPDMPPLSVEEQHMVMHVKLPIMGGHVLMGTDMIESMGHHLRIGNNTTVMLEPDDRGEADRLFSALSQDSTESAGMMEMFWGAYWGVCLDQFGIRWMINVDPE